jgi:hypothetical protein
MSDVVISSVLSEEIFHDLFRARIGKIEIPDNKTAAKAETQDHDKCSLRYPKEVAVAELD